MTFANTETHAAWAEVGAAGAGFLVAMNVSTFLKVIPWIP
jgi:hypothetical protein